MGRYAVAVKEILKRTVIVEDAEDIQDAISKVEEAVNRDEILLDLDDYDEREIEPSFSYGNGTGEIPDGENVSFYYHLKASVD